MAVPNLTPGTTYGWEALGRLFGFKPDYFARAGGLITSKATGCLLVRTDPGGARSFDYADYWDDGDLVYTGSGQVGDQKRTGQNLDVADNRRPLLVFEAADTKALRYLGQARCVAETTGQAPDRDGQMRTVLLFRLRFDANDAASLATPVEVPPERRMPAPQSPERRQRQPSRSARTPRTFDPSARPKEPQGSGGSGADPAQTQALREKAQQGHHDLVCAWASHLRSDGWTEPVEITDGYDLLSASPDGDRVIFEMKTLSGSNELSQCRSAVSQLLEYRFRHGEPGDQLCLVTNAPVPVDRAEILEALGVAAIAQTQDGWQPSNGLGARLLTGDAPPLPSPAAQFLAAQRRLEAAHSDLADQSLDDQAREQGVPRYS